MLSWGMRHDILDCNAGPSSKRHYHYLASWSAGILNFIGKCFHGAIALVCAAASPSPSPAEPEASVWA